MPIQEKSGCCLWFTGLSGAGKSTLADNVAKNLMSRSIDTEILDGDKLRSSTSNSLTFSKEDRLKNIMLAGNLALNATRLGKVAVVSLISPYENARQDVSRMFSPEQFVLIHVATPLEICEARDVKGLYGKARRGEIEHFTGISDVYENPVNPDITIDTSSVSIESGIKLVLEHNKVNQFLHSRLS